MRLAYLPVNKYVTDGDRKSFWISGYEIMIMSILLCVIIFMVLEELV